MLGVVVALALAGCADARVSGTDAQPGLDAGPTTSTATSSPDRLASPTPPTGPVGGIPADLVLPGQADGQVEPRTDLGRLYDHICLDPQDQEVLGAGFVEAQTVILPGDTLEGAATIEKLAAYRSVHDARHAVGGLRVQVDLCGRGVDHAGRPSTWAASKNSRLRSADEALRLTHRSAGVVDTVVTVVRVGRAVFFIDRREQHADGVPADERTIVDLVPALTAAFG